jgi:hypothetical protein
MADRKVQMLDDRLVALTEWRKEWNWEDYWAVWLVEWLATRKDRSKGKWWGKRMGFAWEQRWVDWMGILRVGHWESRWVQSSADL